MAIIPEGKYRAKSRGAEIGEAKTGTIQVAVDFEFTTASMAGQHITWIGFFTEKAVERTLEALRYAGWTSSDPDDLSSLRRADVPEVELVVEHEDQVDENNKIKTNEHGEPLKRARVRWVNRAAMAMKQLDPAKKASFAQSLRAQLAAVDQRLKGTSPGSAPSTPPPPAGDIPF